MQTYLKTKPVWIQLLLFIGMAFGLLMIASLIGVLILSKLTGISMMAMSDAAKWSSTDPNMILFIRGMLLIQFLALFLIPSLLFGYFSDPAPISYLGLKAPSKNSYWIMGIAALLLAIPLVEYTGLLNRQVVFDTHTQKWMQSMEEEAMKQIQFMMRKHTPTELLLNLIFIAAFAGVGEELFFRGVLQSLFIQLCKNPWIGIIITAILFSGFHFQFFGFIPRFLLGIILGAIYWYSGSLWPAIVAHFVYDGFIIVMAYLQPNIVQDPNATIIASSSLAIAASVSALLVSIILWQMKKHSTTTYQNVYKNDQPSINDEFSF